MSDLIERLRYLARDDQDMPSVFCGKAADEIERLERQVRNAQGAVVIAKEWIAEKDTRIAELEQDRDRWKNRHELNMKNENLRIAELEGERKRDCCEFFRWFWNSPGTNAEQGYDEWKTLKD